MNALLDAPPQASAPTRPHRPGTASLLYVEDDDVIRKTATQALIRCGYPVTAAADGLEGWEALRMDHFDLLVTANEMPRLTGLQLVTKVRLEGMTLPIIVASASARELAKTARQWHDLTATLQKPFATSELLATVQNVLRTSSSIRPEQQMLSPAFAEVLRHIQPYRHWGINE
jgi:two-component system, OmpR family, response regulator MtrA